jgi:hypothetical protein
MMTMLLGVAVSSARWILMRSFSSLPVRLVMSSSRSKMREDLVGQEKAGFAAGNRDACAGQVVELAESPGERRLAALVRPGDDEDPFRAAEAELVGDNGAAAGDQPGREGQVEGIAGEDLLRVRGDSREAELQPR